MPADPAEHLDRRALPAGRRRCRAASLPRPRADRRQDDLPVELPRRRAHRRGRRGAAPGRCRARPPATRDRSERTPGARRRPPPARRRARACGRIQGRTRDLGQRVERDQERAQDVVEIAQAADRGGRRRRPSSDRQHVCGQGVLPSVSPRSRTASGPITPKRAHDRRRRRHGSSGSTQRARAAISHAATSSAD